MSHFDRTTWCFNLAPKNWKSCPFFAAVMVGQSASDRKEKKVARFTSLATSSFVLCSTTWHLDLLAKLTHDMASNVYLIRAWNCFWILPPTIASGKEERSSQSHLFSPTLFFSSAYPQNEPYLRQSCHLVVCSPCNPCLHANARHGNPDTWQNEMSTPKATRHTLWSPKFVKLVFWGGSSWSTRKKEREEVTVS